MGGKALKNVPTRRYNRVEFNEIWSVLGPQLKSKLGIKFSEGVWRQR